MITNKKKYGQYFTNELIAKLMIDWTCANTPTTFLDPAAGEGVFIKLGRDLNKKIKVTAYDIDKNLCNKLIKKFQSNDINIINADYLNTPNKKYDAIVCNPPYNKFQKIKSRKTLIQKYQKHYNIKLNGYSNLCIYFLIKSLNEINKNGRCAYIMPYEFLNTGYGEKIKQYFITKRILHSIIKFDNSLKLFEEAITTSCILLFENTQNDKINFINITSIEDFEKRTFVNKKTYQYSELNPKEKWLNYFNNKNTFHINNTLIQLKEIGQVKRGIATGNNAYFTLNPLKISELNLSDDVCLPCITKCADIKSLLFDNYEFEKLKMNNKKIYIFNGLNAKTNSDFEYLRNGETAGFDKTYLTSHRKPWYSIEKKEPAPILLSVFCRNKLKVIRNTTNVRHLTTFHGFYFNKPENINFINLCFCYLLTPTAQKLLFYNKREYGDGLEKFEPNDLNNAYIININKIKENDKNKILKIYNNIQNIKEHEFISQLDEIFSTYIT